MVVSSLNSRYVDLLNIYPGFYYILYIVVLFNLNIKRFCGLYKFFKRYWYFINSLLIYLIVVLSSNILIHSRTFFSCKLYSLFKKKIKVSKNECLNSDYRSSITYPILFDSLLAVIFQIKTYHNVVVFLNRQT